jgi:hypothetical protein
MRYACFFVLLVLLGGCGKQDRPVAYGLINEPSYYPLGEDFYRLQREIIEAAYPNGRLAEFLPLDSHYRSVFLELEYIETLINKKEFTQAKMALLQLQINVLQELINKQKHLSLIKQGGHNE